MKTAGESPEVAELCVVLNGLIAAIAPYAARHKVDKCFCPICNNLRRQLLIAAKTAEKFGVIEI